MGEKTDGLTLGMVAAEICAPLFAEEVFAVGGGCMEGIVVMYICRQRKEGREEERREGGREVLAK